MTDGEAVPRESTNADEAAIAYLDAYAAGEQPSTDRFLQRLASPEERQEYQEILRYAITVGSFPPGVIRPGERFGPYLIEEKLAQGGMGVVFRAQDIRLERSVAIKTLPPESSTHEVFGRRLELESCVLAQLDHPNIVKVYEAGTSLGVRYVVMDYVDGVSIADVITQLSAEGAPNPSAAELLRVIGTPEAHGRVPTIDEGMDYWEAIARITREFARAIEAAHAESILHRDLKPGNILVTAGGSPVVLDFGLAGLDPIQGGTVTQGLFGSVPYLAPEQIRDMKSGFDFRTDIYQLGLVLYEMLVLRRAFPQENQAELLERIRFGQFPAPRRVNPKVPRDLEAICLTAAEPDPTRRYPSARALTEDLDRYLSNRPIRGRPPSAVRRAGLFARRNRRSLIIAAMALVLGAVAAWWWYRSDSRVIPPPRPFRVRLDAPEQFRLFPRTVQPGDILGLEIEVREATHVYALSVVGERAADGRPRFVRAVAPILQSDLTREEDSSERTSLALPPGSHRVCFARAAAAPRSVLDWQEGLWVFCSRERHPWLEGWIRDLLRIQKSDLSTGDPGLSLEAAMKPLRAPPRGDAIKLDFASRKQLAAALESGQTESQWPLRDPRPITVYFRLAPPK